MSGHFFNTLRGTLRSADASARSLYGPGPGRFFKYARISLFSLNRFIVFCADTRSYTPPCDTIPLAEWPLDKLAEYRRGKGLPKEFYADRLHHLRRVWVAEVDGEPAYIIWAGESADPSPFLRLRPGDAEIGHITTMPEFRRQGLHRRGMASLVALLGREGFTKVYGTVHDGNIYSLRGLEAAGMEPVGEVRALGPWRFKKDTATFWGGRA